MYHDNSSKQGNGRAIGQAKKVALVTRADHETGKRITGMDLETNLFDAIKNDHTTVKKIMEHLLDASIDQKGGALLPKTGLVRLSTILQVVPVSKTTWWEGVKSQRFPQPVKLGPRTTCWYAEDIRRIICKEYQSE